MPITIHQEDTIPHISLAHSESLEAKSASTSGCVGLLGVLEFCYRISGSDVKIDVKLAGVSIGEININPEHPTAKVGGSVAGMGAEASVTLHTSPWSLEFCGKVKYLFGSKHGCTTVHL